MPENIKTFADKPAPTKPMTPSQTPQHVQVGGRIIVNDGKSRREVKMGDAPPAKKEDKPEDKTGKKEEGVDLQSGLDALRERLGLKKKEDKKEDPKPDDKKVAGAEAAGGKGEGDKKADDKKEDKAKVVKRSKGQLTPDLVEAVAKSAAKAAIDANASAKEKPDTKKEEGLELSDSDRRDYEVLKFMESQGDKYKGISRKFLKFVPELEGYISGWEKENPGKEFNPNDEAHADFYAKHEPKYDADDFENARIEMRVESKLKERSKELDEKYSSIEADVIEQKLRPEIGRKIGESVSEMVNSVDVDAAKLIVDKGVDALADSDPIAFEALDRAAAELGSALTELEKLTHPSGKFKFKQDNPVHVWIDRFAGSLEKEIKSLPLEDQIRDGKLFATSADLRQIPEAQRARYWFLDPPTIRRELVRYYADNAKKYIEVEKKKHAAYQQKYGVSSSKSANSSDPDNTSKADKKTEKPNSPAAATDANAASSQKVEGAPVSTPISSLVAKMFPS